MCALTNIQQLYKWHFNNSYLYLKSSSFSLLTSIFKTIFIVRSRFSIGGSNNHHFVKLLTGNTGTMKHLLFKTKRVKLNPIILKMLFWTVSNVDRWIWMNYDVTTRPLLVVLFDIFPFWGHSINYGQFVDNKIVDFMKKKIRIHCSPFFNKCKYILRDLRMLRKFCIILFQLLSLRNSKPKIFNSSRILYYKVC